VKQRIITALIIAPLTIACVFLLPLKFFMLFSAALFLLASKEWGDFVSRKKSRLVLYLFAVLLGITVFIVPIEQLWVNGAVNPLLSYCLNIAVLWWCLSLLMVISYPKTAAIWADSKIIKSLMGLFTLLPFFWGMLLLRSVNMQFDFYFGAQLLMFVFALVWAADTGAYFFGKKFGKHKLAVNVSPGKTIEGFLGGLISAMLVAFFGTLFFAISTEKMFLFFVAAFVTTIVSTLGDLNESIFKREAGLKDSGNLLPGHGGILDRIDSLTAAVPVFAAIYLTWLN
jgi:phosphatidate cytidylyltransferase